MVTAEDKETGVTQAVSLKYDRDNEYAKILDKKEKCFKVYESYYAIAFLEKNPMAEGHTVVIPKLMGYEDVVSMPPEKAAKLLGEVQEVAHGVKAAFGADGVNIVQENGTSAGQRVMHPSFHIIPRKTNDGVKLLPPNASSALAEDAATPLIAKLTEALEPKRPPVKLRQAKWGVVSDIMPDSTGANLRVKVMEEPKKVPNDSGREFYEFLVGDHTGTVVASLSEQQLEHVKKDAVIALRNGHVTMHGKASGFIRIIIDRWGKVEACDEELEGDVPTQDSKNRSKTEYELVEMPAGGKGKSKSKGDDWGKGKGKKGKGKGKNWW